MANLTIDPEFRDLIPPLSENELAGLQSSIIAQGCRDSLVIWKESQILLDGHNRYRICKERGAPFTTKEISLPTRDDALLWIIRNQMNRRNLDAGQRAALAVEMIPLLEKEAKKRISEAVTRRHAQDQRIKELESSEPHWIPLPHAAQMEIKAIGRDHRNKANQEAQQVYFIATGAGKIKIGISVLPNDRLKSFQTLDPDAKLIATLPGGKEVEKWVHGILEKERMQKSELFHDSLVVREEIESLCNLAKNSQVTEFHSAAVAAKSFGVSSAYVKQAKDLKKRSPKAFEAVKHGKKRLRVAIDESRREERQAKRMDAVKDAPPMDERIIIGDFRKHADKVTDGSISLIFTDPPYDREASKMLPALGEFAAKKLADGGSLLLYVGQTQIPAALDALRPHLRYWWTIACIHAGRSTVMREYGVNAGWKAVLWFVKGTRDDNSIMVRDVMSGGEEKFHHDWQQSQAEAQYWIENLCPKNGMVCDPFLGSGTTAAAAKLLNRKWIGFEIDEATAKIASGRVG